MMSALMDRMMPRLPDAWQRAAMSGLQAGIALMAFVSLNPYFMWSTQKIYYAAASILLVASFAGCHRLLSPGRDQVFLCVAFSLFLVYLSLLPKVQGPPTRWFFLIPFAVAVLAVERGTLRQAFEKFYWLFALSLIPGMLVWTWLVAGLPLELEYLTPPSNIVNRGVTDYFGVPGAIMLPSNAVILPTGGIMFRLCAVYDEPGTVGTIAALCLAVTRFRLKEARGAISFVAGIMSFSLAFAILTAIGLIATSVGTKRLGLSLAALASIAIGIVTFSGVIFDQGVTRAPTITVLAPASESASAEGDRATMSLEQFGLDHQTRLRFAPHFDNRAHPAMRKLFADYADSSPWTILFGIASNASNVYGWGSAAWYSILTDYGVVGFVWLFFLYFVPLFWLWRAGRLDMFAVLFCALYLMSFYQRPVIWLPAQMLIYFAGIYWFATNRDQARAGAIYR